ncbi:MAG: hypothetical protein ACLRXA_24615, partial [Clostridium sp.]
AIALENAAARAMERGMAPVELSFPLREEGNVLLADRTPLIRKIFRETKGMQAWYKEKDRTEKTEALALGFHEAVAQMVLDICRRLRERFQENRIALSGGVFANVILQACGNPGGGRVLVCERKVPGNDGGIALGQALLAAWSYWRAKTHRRKNYVRGIAGRVLEIDGSTALVDFQETECVRRPGWLR